MESLQLTVNLAEVQCTVRLPPVLFIGIHELREHNYQEFFF